MQTTRRRLLAGLLMLVTCQSAHVPDIRGVATAREKQLTLLAAVLGYERRVPRRDRNQRCVAGDSRRSRRWSGGPAMGDERVPADTRVAVVDRRLAWRCVGSEARVLGWRWRVRTHFGSLRGRVVDPRAMRVSFDAGGVRGAGDAYRIGGDHPRVCRRRAGQGDRDMDRAQLDRRGYRAVHRGSVDRCRLVAPDLCAQCAARTRDRDADCSWHARERERWQRRASGLPWVPSWRRSRSRVRCSL